MFSFGPANADQADALVFHLPDLLLGAPWRADMMALAKRPGQIWVAWSMESAINAPLLDDPALRATIDLFMTYRRDSAIWSPYVPARRLWRAALAGPPPQKIASAPLVMFQSSAANKSGRARFARRLMRRIPVDSYGRFMRTRELPGRDEGQPTKLAVVGQYKFCLALENAIEEDYVTEKFFDPLLAGSVPVYRGAPNVAEFAPGERCYIDANAFRDERELADYLHYLDRNDAAYASFLAWRTKPLLSGFERMLDIVWGDSLERLAYAVAGRAQL
jgi:alpha-1,3-fucosyltransferase 10